MNDRARDKGSPRIDAISADVFDHAAVGLLITRADDLTILRANAHFTQLLGYPAVDLVGRDVSSLCTSGDDGAKLFAREARVAFEHGSPFTVERELPRVGGGTRWARIDAAMLEAPQGAPRQVLWTLIDVTDYRNAEERARRLAFYDELTALPNRALLHDRLEMAIAGATRRGKRGAVVVLDIDALKDINDSSGRGIGDALLVEAASRLRTSVRSSDTVARLSGDEFVLLLTEVSRPGLAVRAVERALGRLRQPFDFGGRELSVTATAGIAVFPDDFLTPDVLLRNAGTALHAAKRRKRDAFQFFVPALNAEVTARLAMEGDLRQAIDREELTLHFQPQVDLVSGRLVGLEALARWRHPTDGMVPPGKFIPIAEDSGLIVPLGTWVLQEACRELRRLRSRGLLDVTIAVNVSSVQFQQRDFPAMVHQALRAADVPPEALELEVTESVVMCDVERVLASLDELRLRGLRLSIDDFGTGYSSLAYLKRLAVQKLKIDQSFIRGTPHDHGDSAITTAIVRLGQTLGLRVIAEGVETIEQMRFLCDAGAHEAQGYYLARPIPGTTLHDVLFDSDAQDRWRNQVRESAPAA
jgi:diguanylate cyclase (GGDEF)-like protein/PAS domain S-box-containing protein